MRISPLDIKKQEFAVKFRGYAPDEVHSYLEMVASELEDALRRNLELEQKISLLQEKLSSYTRLENILQETLVNTQKAAEETRAAAEKKSGNLINEAQMKARALLAGASERLVAIQREFSDLRNQRDSFLVNFRSLLETQLSLLELVERRGEQKDDFTPIKKKVDLNDEELEKVVKEFEQKLSEGNKNPGGGNPIQLPGEEK